MAQAGTVPRSPLEARQLIYDRGSQGAEDVILQAAARDGVSKDDICSAMELARTWPVPPAPFKASDLQARGLAPGPRLGAALREAVRLWRAADFPKSPETVEGILSTAIRATLD